MFGKVVVHQVAFAWRRPVVDLELALLDTTRSIVSAAKAGTCQHPVLQLNCEEGVVALPYHTTLAIAPRKGDTRKRKADGKVEGANTMTSSILLASLAIN